MRDNLEQAWRANKVFQDEYTEDRQPTLTQPHVQFDKTHQKTCQHTHKVKMSPSTAHNVWLYALSLPALLARSYVGYWIIGIAEESHYRSIQTHQPFCDCRLTETLAKLTQGQKKRFCSTTIRRPVWRRRRGTLNSSSSHSVVVEILVLCH